VLLAAVHDSERVEVMVEAIAVSPHLAIEFFFAGVGERWMTDIVRQCECFGQILVKSERTCDRSRDLGDLDGVSETVTEMVMHVRAEDLRFVFEPAECTGMYDSIAVAREIVSIGVR